MVKAAATRRWLEEGHRVKAIMLIRGRLVTRKEMAEAVLTRLTNELADIAKPDGTAKMEGANNLSLVLVRKK
jgi:translation initiation factor IF-3